MTVDPDADEPKGKDPSPTSRQTPPEVEAEIVDADFSDAEPVRDEAVREKEADQQPPYVRKPFLRPLVMVVAAIAAIAAIAITIWMLLPERAPQQVVPTPADGTPDILPEPPTQPGTQPVPEEAPPPEPEASKILNTPPGAGFKETVGEFDAPAEEGARGLPPPPSGNANEGLQQAAKEALRTYRPPAPAANIEAERAGQAFDGDLDAEIAEPGLSDPAASEQDLPEADGSDGNVEELVAPGAESGGPQTFQSPDGGKLDALEDQGGSRAPAPSDATAKISNDIAALKDLFDNETSRLSSELSAERARADAMGREIASLRESLGEAIARRDDERGADIAEIKAELDKIRADRETAALGRANAAAIALVTLQQKLISGAPYRQELDLLAGFAPYAAGIEALRGRAETGAPTIGALKASFAPALRAALAADLEARAKGPLAAFWARLGGLVSVRPADPREGTDAPAVISRAEARLDADDLAGAVRELYALEGPAREAMSSWLEQAEARLEAEAALASLAGALAGAHQN